MVKNLNMVIHMEMLPAACQCVVTITKISVYIWTKIPLRQPHANCMNLYVIYNVSIVFWIDYLIF